MTDLEMLTAVMQRIEDSRPNLFCHLDEEPTVREALARTPQGGMFNLFCSPVVPRGTVLCSLPRLPGTSPDRGVDAAAGRRAY